MIIQNWQNNTVLKATIKKENKTNGTCLIKKKKGKKNWTDCFQIIILFIILNKISLLYTLGIGLATSNNTFKPSKQRITQDAQQRFLTFMQRCLKFMPQIFTDANLSNGWGKIGNADS